MKQTLQAGAGTTDITPVDSQFLFGYPHVPRMSTGVHDPLFSSALYLSDGRTKLLFIANDVIYVSKASAVRARERIERAAGVPASNVMVTATHTHSGPKTLDHLSNEADPAVPPADERYVRRLEDGIVAAARVAVASAQPAKIGLAVANVQGVGTNRRDPSGPADPQAPVLLARSARGDKPLAAMIVYSMHPTVLHEDSTLISADFPGMAREYLQQHVLGRDCPVLYHMGPSGNQSPRHCVRGQTFAEAKRLGELLGRSAEAAISQIEFRSEVKLSCRREYIPNLPAREFPTVEQAEAHLRAIEEKLHRQQRDGTPRAVVRTTECDWFGAEETVVLARAACDGRMEKVRRACLPAEIQVFRVGDWAMVGWQGECFVEYSLAIKARFPNAFVISCANGEFQGYIVTPEAVAEGGYEASNAVFKPESGRLLVDATLKMLGEP